MTIHWRKIPFLAACLFSLVLMGSGWGNLAQAEPSSRVWSGWVGKISDSMCGAKHKIADAKQCTLACVRKGANYVLVVGDPGVKIYTLDGKASDFEPLAGALAKVQGDLNGTTLKVTSVEAYRR